MYSRYEVDAWNFNRYEDLSRGLLQGLSRIEAAGYAKLAELGATPLRAVVTAGGGAKNAAWMQMRERLLGVSVTAASQAEAAFGAALLGMRGLAAPH